MVKVLDVEFNEEIEYEIVGSSHSNSLEDKISSESPLGAAMMGKKVGDEVVVEAPAGVFRYRILGIRKPDEAGE